MKIELQGWIEWTCRMRVRKRGLGVRLEQVNVGGKREGLVEERVKEKEYCSARWTVRWAVAFRDYNRLVTGQSGGLVVRKPPTARSSLWPFVHSCVVNRPGISILLNELLRRKGKWLIEGMLRIVDGRLRDGIGGLGRIWLREWLVKREGLGSV